MLQGDAEGLLRDAWLLCRLVEAVSGVRLKGVAVQPRQRGGAARNVEIALEVLRARAGMASRWLWSGKRFVDGEGEAVWGLLADVHAEYGAGEDARGAGGVNSGWSSCSVSTASARSLSPDRDLDLSIGESLDGGDLSEGVPAAVAWLAEDGVSARTARVTAWLASLGIFLPIPAMTEQRQARARGPPIARHVCPADAWLETGLHALEHPLWNGLLLLDVVDAILARRVKGLRVTVPHSVHDARDNLALALAALVRGGRLPAPLLASVDAILQGDEAVVWGVLDSVRHLSVLHGDYHALGPDAVARPKKGRRPLPYTTRRVAALQRAILLWVQDLHYTCGVPLPDPPSAPAPPDNGWFPEMEALSAANAAQPFGACSSASSSDSDSAVLRDLRSMAPCGDLPPTLADLLPGLRSGVLLADIAAAATGETFVVCRAARTTSLPRRVAENNVRAVCEKLKTIQTVGHRFSQDTDKILAGDREVLLGLLEELLKAHDGVSADRRLLRRGEDVPYLGKYAPLRRKLRAPRKGEDRWGEDRWGEVWWVAARKRLAGGAKRAAGAGNVASALLVPGEDCLLYSQRGRSEDRQMGRSFLVADEAALVVPTEVVSPGKLEGARVLTLQQWLRKIPVAWPSGATSGGLEAFGGAFRSGVALCDLVAALERRHGSIPGVNRRPKTSASCRQNVLQGLAVVRLSKAVDREVLLEVDAFVAGHHEATVAVLTQVRRAFAPR